jgi:hypothetical protein
MADRQLDVLSGAASLCGPEVIQQYQVPDQARLTYCNSLVSKSSTSLWLTPQLSTTHSFSTRFEASIVAQDALSFLTY